MDGQVRVGRQQEWPARTGEQRMFRYVALVWNISNEQQSRTAESLDGQLRARQWTVPFSGEGLRVFCTDLSATLRALALANDAGVVLGTLFERNRDIDDDT